MYLIVKCEELNDQYECDADRTPITLTENWGAWFSEVTPDYAFEVYELRDNEFVRIKDYDTPIESGMALYYWTSEQMNSNAMGKPTVVQKWKNATRNKSMPKQIYARAKKFYVGTDAQMKHGLTNCGYVAWEDDKENWWVYGEYYDSMYTTGF